MANVEIMKREHVARKEFKFSKGEVNLAFQLRLDMKELGDFKHLLEAALEDVNTELIKLPQ